MQHEKEVSVPGWSGTGYMVIDNTNGDGAFLIGGGGNGGFLPDWASNALSGMLIFGSILMTGSLLLSIQIIVVSVTIALIVDGYLEIVNQEYGNDECDRTAKMFGLLYGGMSAFAGFKIAKNFLEEIELLIISLVTINSLSAASQRGLEAVCK